MTVFIHEKEIYDFIKELVSSTAYDCDWWVRLPSAHNSVPEHHIAIMVQEEDPPFRPKQLTLVEDNVAGLKLGAVMINLVFG